MVKTFPQLFFVKKQLLAYLVIIQVLHHYLTTLAMLNLWFVALLKFAAIGVYFTMKLITLKNTKKKLYPKNFIDREIKTYLKKQFTTEPLKQLL